MPTVVLKVNGNGTRQEWAPLSGTDHAAMVDEGCTAPDTITYLHANPGNSASTRDYLTLEDVPADFGTAVSYEIRMYVYATGRNDDSIHIDSFVTLGDAEDSGFLAAQAHITNPANGVWNLVSSAVTANTDNAAAWNSRKIRLDTVRDQVKGGDSIQSRASAIDVVLVYNSTGESHSGSTVVTGGGTATAGGRKNARAVSAYAGGGTITALARKAGRGLTLLPGGGTLTGLGRKGARGVTALAGGGALTAIGSAVTAVHTLLTGGGTLTGAGRKGARGLAIQSGGGTLAASVRKGARGSALFSGGGALTASARRAAFGVASIVAGGQQIAVARKGGRGPASVAGGGGLATAARKGARGVAAVAGGGFLAAVGQAVGAVHTVLAGGGGLVATGAKGALGATAALGGGTLAVLGRAARRGVALLTGGGVITSAGTDQIIIEVPVSIRASVRAQDRGFVIARVQPGNTPTISAKPRPNSGTINVSVP